jgi:xanthine dehydrogenase iron-sulfur cluster and FAD-binding subunit A
MLHIYNNIDDYSPEELFNLEQAGEQLLICEQGDIRTLEQTRIMVAYKRLKQERNFKIVAEKAVRIPKEKKVKEIRIKKMSKKAFNDMWIKTALGVELTADELVQFEYSKPFFGM